MLADHDAQLHLVDSWNAPACIIRATQEMLWRSIAPDIDILFSITTVVTSTLVS